MSICERIKKDKKIIRIKKKFEERKYHLRKDVIKEETEALKKRRIKESTLTNEDYEYIKKVKNFGSLRGIIIIKEKVQIFDAYYKEGVLKSIKEGFDLSEEQKISINCLSLSLQLLKHGDSDFIHIMMSLLKDMSDYVTKHLAATRITEVILYKFCECSIYESIKEKDELHKICKLYWKKQNITEEIKLSSAVLLVKTNLKIKEDTDYARKYLCHIIQEMKIKKLKDYVGFSLKEIYLCLR